MPKKKVEKAGKESLDEKKIEAYALANALAHNGKAQASAVLPKLFQEGLKKEDIKKVMPLIQKIVKEVNSMKLEEQQKLFLGFEKLVKKREEREGLPPLPNAQQGKVVMRFAPFPSGPLHIGNAKPAILNDEYCKMYKGKLLLVIDDTIGSEEKTIAKEAYNLIPESLKWLQVKYALPIIYKSDRLNVYYSYAEQLIRKKKAYVCFCDSETLHKNREQGKECEHRKYDLIKNLEEWNNMLDYDYKPGQATLRIKTDMKHKNPAFRDRVLFRITDREHPKTGKRYRVWPMLEFSWAIDDHLLGVTHILRGKDLMMESEMEKYIWDIFGWKAPELIHSGIVTVKGAKISKSKSAKEVLDGVYRGWDDPRTWSLQSLARRGIRPEALRTFFLSLGLTQTEATVPVENLYKENKKFVEQSNRYFFVPNPVKIKVKSAPRMKAKVPLHPDHVERGYRDFDTFEDFYIQKRDYEEIEKNRKKNYRFMHLFNFVKSDYFEFISKEYDEKLAAKLIHWLPCIKELVKTEVVMPDGTIVEGLAEPMVRELKIDDICQFERFGFVRCDSKTKDKMVFWFAHG
ncbi:MAG: glutamate--tRNA ligase [Candidatus Pacearchaeota archaeon]